MLFRLPAPYEESMTKVIEVKNYKQLKKVLEDHYKMKLKGINFEMQGYDVRNFWYTHLVKANFEGVTPGLPVGWSNSDHFD